jgi:transposase
VEITPRALLGRIEQLQVALDEALKRVAVLEKENAELRALLGRNSSNSSLPPSSDRGKVKRPSRGKGKRKRGGQAGHKVHRRTLLPAERVTEVVQYRPQRCAHCDGRLQASHCAAQPRRHQVVELAPITVDVTEHQAFCARCPRCHEQTEATIPREVYRSVVGPDLTALMSLLSGKYHLSKREVAEFVRDVLEVPISASTVCGREAVVSEALSKPYAQVQRYIQGQSRMGADETSWVQCSDAVWLWVVTAAQASLFSIEQGRGKAVARRLIGPDFAGVLHSDRYNAYAWVDPEHRQLCWAHIKRNIQSLVDRGGNARRAGQRLAAQAREVFRLWHRFTEGIINRDTLRRHIRRLRQRLRTLLQRGVRHRARHVRSLCRGLLGSEQSLWTFAFKEAVEPTNNQSERDLRKAVLWRKCSFRTDSATGSRFVERILTASETLRKQGRSLFAFLRELCRAHAQRKALPSLLPA